MNLVYSSTLPQLTSGRIELDKIYGASLEKILEGAPLAKIVDHYLTFLETSSLPYRYAVTELVNDDRSLSVLAAPSLPAALLKSLHHQPVSKTTGACGPAVLSQTPYFIANIASHCNWRDFSEDVGQSGIFSLWSFPLIYQGQCRGTFVVAGNRKCEPDTHTVSHFKSVATNLAKVFTLCESQQRKSRDAWQLTLQTQRQQEQISALTQSCQKLLAKQSLVESAYVKRPLPNGFQHMAEGFIEDVRDALNVARTTLSFQQVVTAQNKQQLEQKALNKQALLTYYQSVNRACAEGEKIMSHAQKRVNELDLYLDRVTQNTTRPLLVCQLMSSLINTIAANDFQAVFYCIDIPVDLEFRLPEGTFTQVICELILNVYRHAYPNCNDGRVWLSAQVSSRNNRRIMKLVVEDRGVGIDKTVTEHAMRPLTDALYSQDKTLRGLSACYHQVTSEMGGTFSCDSHLGSGTRMVMYIPEAS
ncbi:ATP-binding protein [Aestuariibacter sp. A3R04]|uniref:ATP-binding protein n=1 Tax=Aestuariibacter sp. A3R04 TaxID=2841571 RepID=UPI001C087CAD|nr:ATP-binding protein [Aestuariibacter sp. A3R04]MBU3021505.1 GAF domain-containing protein [Aestuariibacter sp. A3R04]